MSDSKWGRVYVQSAAPDGALVALNDVWVDSDSQRFYVCTSVSPVTFTPVNQAETTGAVGELTVGTVDILGNTVSLGASVQTAVNTLQAKIDTILTKLKTSGLMAS